MSEAAKIERGNYSPKKKICKYLSALKNPPVLFWAFFVVAR